MGAHRPGLPRLLRDLLAVWLLLFAPAAAGALPAAPDAALWVPDGAARALAVDGDTLYVGGSFSLMAPRTGRLVRIDGAGARVAGWPEVRGGDVRAVEADGAGGWYIGGGFTHVGGIARARVAHLGPDGTLDSGFAPAAPDGPVLDLELSGDTLYLGGAFRFVGGSWRQGIAAVAAGDGALRDWDPDVQGRVEDLEMVGTVLVAGGDFLVVNGGHAWRPYLAGFDTTSPGAEALEEPDPRFNAPVRALAVSGPDLVVGGDFTQLDYGATMRSHLAALDTATWAVQAWDPGADGAVHSLAVDGGLVYAGGAFGSSGGQARSRIAALDAATGEATAWNPGADGTVRALAVSGGAVWAGGDFRTAAGVRRVRLARLDAGTGAATAWNPGAGGAVHVTVPTGDGVLAGGGFDTAVGVARDNLAAVDITSGVPTAWNPGTAGEVRALAAGGGAVYVAGTLFTVAGQQRLSLAAVDAGTGAARPLNVQPGVVGEIRALALDGDRLLVGGDFTTLGGAARDRLGAVDLVSGEVTGWDPGADGRVSVLLLDGRRLYAGGEFTALGGVPRSGLGALDADTGAPLAWDPSPDGAVATLALSGTQVLAGGSFSAAGGRARPYAVLLDPETGAAEDWDAGIAGGAVTGAAVHRRTVLLSGFFTGAGGQARGGLAALDAHTAEPAAWAPTATEGYAGAPALATPAGFVVARSVQPEGVRSPNLASFTDPPVVSGAPWVTGQAGEGSTLTCEGGAWAPAGAASWRWQRDGADIPGATGTSYVQQAADTGSVLGCVLTVVNLGGSGSGASAPAGSPAPPAVTVAPAVSGTAAVGATLTCATGSWSGSPTSLDPSWWRDGEVQVGSGATRVVGQDDAGHGLVCRVRATGAGGFATADAAAAQVPVRPASLTPPAVSGTAGVGEALTCDPGTWSGAVSSLAFQWLDAGMPVEGATSSGLVVPATGAVQALACRVTAHGPGGTRQATSATAWVDAPPALADGDASRPALDGGPTQGGTITCSTGVWTGWSLTHTRVWRRDGVAIPGATGASYVVAAADVGALLSCAVTATGAGGSTTAVTDAVRATAAPAAPPAPGPAREPEPPRAAPEAPAPSPGPAPAVPATPPPVPAPVAVPSPPAPRAAPSARVVPVPLPATRPGRAGRAVIEAPGTGFRLVVALRRLPARLRVRLPAGVAGRARVLVVRVAGRVTARVAVGPAGAAPTATRDSAPG